MYMYINWTTVRDSGLDNHFVCLFVFFFELRKNLSENLDKPKNVVTYSTNLQNSNWAGER